MRTTRMKVYEAHSLQYLIAEVKALLGSYLHKNPRYCLNVYFPVEMVDLKLQVYFFHR